MCSHVPLVLEGHLGPTMKSHLLCITGDTHSLGTTCPAYSHRHENLKLTPPSQGHRHSTNLRPTPVNQHKVLQPRRYMDDIHQPHSHPR